MSRLVQTVLGFALIVIRISTFKMHIIGIILFRVKDRKIFVGDSLITNGSIDREIVVGILLCRFTLTLTLTLS